MDIYAIHDLGKLLAENPYHGRGIVVGKSADGTHAAMAYFIMGRSVNSRNRIFEETDDGIRTRAFDESKMEDPSLIIYHPVRYLDNHIIVSNGEHTDTIRSGLLNGETFSQSLSHSFFEPDAPNWTPRISAVLTRLPHDFCYSMSILKSADTAGSACNRYTYDYTPCSGLGHFLHTYVTDGTPLPTFQGEPKRIAIGNSHAEFTDMIWNNLNPDNKISLYTLWIDLADGKRDMTILNKHQPKGE